jgi:hypothetical protein
MKCHKIRGHNCFFFLMANMNFNGEEREKREKKKKGAAR